MLLQSKQNVSLKSKSRGKKKRSPFGVNSGHGCVYGCKMCGDELSFRNENNQEKLMDDQRDVSEHRYLSLKVFQIKKRL